MRVLKVSEAKELVKPQREETAELGLEASSAESRVLLLTSAEREPCTHRAFQCRLDHPRAGPGSGPTRQGGYLSGPGIQVRHL